MIKVEVLTMPGCTHCASAKETVEKIQDDFPEMKVEIIDVTEHPEVSQKYMLMSAPGIVINGKLEFTGGVKEELLRKKLNDLKG
ncbi:thioredoxin [candidate division TA06 bacterium]|uniref:Thioredoxin n=1 Tax=candidate division TA06 bacterium TaxID=2250710 RepID=A0A523UMU2_UNCT6|nr:MAG: thioredoxin [candidate division TA06 bacterium]